jgi:hypothetical protein
MTPNPLELTTTINTLAVAISCKLNDNELALLSAVLSQLSDTLDTIAVQREICSSGTDADILNLN